MRQGTLDQLCIACTGLHQVSVEDTHQEHRTTHIHLSSQRLKQSLWSTTSSTICDLTLGDLEDIPLDMVYWWFSPQFEEYRWTTWSTGALTCRLQVCTDCKLNVLKTPRVGRNWHCGHPHGLNADPKRTSIGHVHAKFNFYDRVHSTYLVSRRLLSRKSSDQPVLDVTLSWSVGAKYARLWNLKCPRTVCTESMLLTARPTVRAFTVINKVTWMLHLWHCNYACLGNVSFVFNVYVPILKLFGPKEANCSTEAFTS